MSDEKLMSQSQPLQEGIFLQPIDQQYEKGCKVSDILDTLQFFEEYDQEQSMCNIIHMIEDLDLSTDSDSNLGISRQNSTKELDDSSLNSTRISFTKSFLKENWKRNVDELVRNQQHFFRCSVIQNMTHPMNPNLSPISPFNLPRSRAYSTNLKISKFSLTETFYELKQSGSVINSGMPFNAKPFYSSSTLNQI
jgi:hypothetical protein